MRTVAASLVLVAALTAGCSGGDDSADTPTAPLAAAPGPSHFKHPEANPYFPLTPGTITRLRGTDDGEKYLETVTVTSRTELIQGVRTTVISDVNRRSNGVLAERTTDWYAADDQGNVWYFGENTATYDEHGKVESREGTWRAGRKGAKAGLIMPANPKATDAYRQEYLAGDAEDQAWIVGAADKIKVPAGSYDHVVRSYEWSRLEPGVVSVKFYAPGVGIVAERDVAGGSERFELLSVSR